MNDMTVLYEMTVFLAIALIAIVATVFVIAASLLGRAIEESSREHAEIARRESREFDETIAGLRQKLNKAKKAKTIDELKKEIKEYEKKKKEREKDLKRISQRYGLLTVKGTVLYPGMFFLISLVLAGAARYVATLPSVAAANSLWGLSLVALIWGSYRILQCLKVIQSVAITTEEAQFKRTTQALEMALERHEESKRPTLGLEFEKKLPFIFRPSAVENIEFKIGFYQGDKAKAAEVWFFAPEGFEFPRRDTWHQSSDYAIPNAITAKVVLGDLRRWFKHKNRITIKTPPKVGDYNLGYRLYCDVSSGDFMPFKIKVE
jgi:ABC-type multidrug transport system fused ATPase/permease subunit